MRVVINLVLFIAICGLVWVLYNSIREPIAFNTEKDKRETAVTDRLKSIRLSQDLFRQITNDGYAPNFDSLVQTLRNGKIAIISVLGNPDDPEDPTITYDTIYVPAIEKIAELNKINTFKINLDSLQYVPYSNGKIFEIAADTLTYQQTLVNVIEVKTLKADFMGQFASIKYARYDANYDPNSFLKFGDLNAPNLTGNWE
ncbi:MAG: hypothetical protein ACI8P3_001830 [Saprospiraceae bacterium]|jgi:hypothetical protein